MNQFQVEKSLVTAATLLHSLTKPHPLQGETFPKIIHQYVIIVHVYIAIYMVMR